MTISEIMTRRVMTCGPDDTLVGAADLMWNYDCGSVPVIDGERRVVGFLTDRDICMAAYTQGKPLRDIHVRDAMANEVYSCMPDDSIAEAEDIMRTRRVRRLPVIDLEGRLCGLVSLNDIARAAVREQTKRTKDVTPSEVGATLAAICQPRTAVVLPPQV